jgi:hypothetical protein
VHDRPAVAAARVNAQEAQLGALARRVRRPRVARLDHRLRVVRRRLSRRRRRGWQQQRCQLAPVQLQRDVALQLAGHQLSEVCQHVALALVEARARLGVGAAAGQVVWEGGRHREAAAAAARRDAAL